MTSMNIVPASEADAENVCAELRAFNRRAVGEFATDRIDFVVRGDAGELLGGFVGAVYLGWLAIDVLWVDESQRGRGVGSALLDHAEREAVRLGATAAYLDTFDWQAQGFYERHGYHVFGRLDDFPRGHARLFMRKTLVADRLG